MPPPLGQEVAPHLPPGSGMSQTHEMVPRWGEGGIFRTHTHFWSSRGTAGPSLGVILPACLASASSSLRVTHAGLPLALLGLRGAGLRAFNRGGGG